MGRGYVRALWLLSPLLIILTSGSLLGEGVSEPSPPGDMLFVHPQRVPALEGAIKVTVGTSLPQPKLSLAEKGVTVSKPTNAPIAQEAVTGSSALVGAPSAGCAAGSAQPLPIIALASSLNCNPDLIFEYVYNNIEFEPLAGSNKGALGTLLDRRGDDADQAILLVALFNAAGYSQTGFWDPGPLLTGAQISNWLNVKNDALAIMEVLSFGGIQYGNAKVGSDGTLTSINIAHLVAALQLGGTWAYFDPSFKQHSLIPGLSNIAAALGYSRDQFLIDAGGTITSASISGVNRVALRGDLTGYAANLVSYINKTNRTWSVGNIIGGSSITPLTGSPIRFTYPGVTPFTTFPANCPNPPSGPPCRSVISLTMPGATSSQAINLFTDQVYGHRITIFSVPSGNEYVPTLLIDGAAPSCVAAGTCINVGPAVAAGAAVSIAAAITSVYQPSNPACATGVTACKPLTITAGGSYLVSLGIGQVGRGMAEYHRQLLSQALAVGNSISSEAVMGENLAAMSFGWLAENSNEQQITDRIVQTTTQYHFGIGITGQRAIQSTGSTGPYVDLPLNFYAITPQTSGSAAPTVVIGGFNYPTAQIAAFIALEQVSSSLESGVLEQTQAPLAGATAASTMKVVDANMNASYAGALGTTYFADGTTAGGQATYTSTIYPAIQAHYFPGDLATISAAVMGGQQVLIPQNGMLGVGLWTGGGYTTLHPESDGAFVIAQSITGGLSGGFFGQNDPSSPTNTVVTVAPPAATNTVSSLINTTSSATNAFVAEPVDGITGAYLYTHDDLVTGGGAFPYSLPFSRTYQSASGSWLTSTSSDIGMGNGWGHSYDIRAQLQSDPYIGMGASDSSAVSAANTIAALYVMQDLLSVTPTVQTMTVSSMAAHWLTDQLNGNAVMVTQPNTTEEFIALPHPDSATTIAYSPPPGSAARVTQPSAGQFTYQMKDGEALNFGAAPAGALQSWTWPNGMVVNLTYSGSQLTKVSNNLGRNLTLAYTGADVVSVTDDTGRSVGYGYDGNHNLIRSSDPLGAATQFVYDASGVYDMQGHLTQVFYPFQPQGAFVTNWYDALGRVQQQANANGNVSTLHFAGSRTEIVDGMGYRHITYQTNRGRILKDAYLFADVIGTFFYDTPQINGLVNVTTHQYDGLDRLTQTTLPEGGITTYAYATDINPWANNLSSVTQSAKPGSALAPLNMTYKYDPKWNTPTSITDPLGLVSATSYDPATGNLLTQVADANGLRAQSGFTYQANGLLQTTTNALGVVTAYTYDSFANPISVVRDLYGLQRTTITTYSPLGDALTVTDPNNHITTLNYDADRRIINVTTPAAPLPLSTSFTYDPDGHLLQTKQSANGAVLSTTSATYTPSGKMATATDANGNGTRFAFDADDRVSGVTDPLSRVTIFAYDMMNRQLSVSNPAIQSAPLEQIAYTPDGLRASLADANNHSTGYAYDGFDRLATGTYPDSSTGTYTYDADSNALTFKTRKGDTLTFTYDSLNRLKTKAAPSEATVTYGYDLAGHLIGVNDNSPAITAASTAVSYVTTKTYDAMNRLIATSWTPAPAQATPTASSVSFAHTYDATNRRISQSASDNSWWSYPATAGTIAYAPNSLNQYGTVGAVTPSYDGNGNLTFDGTYTYGYDAESRLVSVQQGTTTVASYAFDGQGRRKSKTVGGTATIYVNDADGREVLEYNGTSGGLQTWYAYGAGSNEVLNQMNVPAGTRATLIPDIQGSIIGALASNGTLAKTGYQAYGENPGLAGGSFQYAAQRFDPETAGSTAQPSGLYYDRARMYSPTWGRFLQPDPIGYQGGNNLYAYVGNDPLNNADPSGLGPVGWIVELGETTMRLVRPLFSQADAVAARRSGLNVMAANRQAAGAIENAADGGAGNVIRHAGHDLPDDAVGLPHFQTEGSRGHTFYDVGQATIVAVTAVLNVLDQLDPYHISSTAACETLDCQNNTGQGSAKNQDQSNTGQGSTKNQESTPAPTK